MQFSLVDGFPGGAFGASLFPHYGFAQEFFVFAFGWEYSANEASLHEFPIQAIWDCVLENRDFKVALSLGGMIVI